MDIRTAGTQKKLKECEDFIKAYNNQRFLLLSRHSYSKIDLDLWDLRQQICFFKEEQKIGINILLKERLLKIRYKRYWKLLKKKQRFKKSKIEYGINLSEM